MKKGDYYGGHATDYLRYRPQYPEHFISQVLERTRAHELAWDCGTGNGQVAVRLAKDFQRVWATDISERQIAQAQARSNVAYHCTPAEESGLQTGSVDLVTVGSALHWFDQAAFHREVERVLRPGGLLCCWTYAPELLSPSPLGELVEELAYTVLAEDWPEGLEWVRRGYTDIVFPWTEERLEEVVFELDWSREQLLGWISTWSASKRYESRTGQSVMPRFTEGLMELWPQEQLVHKIQLPLHYRLGRK